LIKVTIGPPPICRGCTRFHADDERALTCDAFPRGIPSSILLSAADHLVPYPGDGGLRFDPIDPESASYAAERFNP
jgi:hypothetical protein